MKYFAFALLLATSCQAGRFQVKVDNGGAFHAQTRFEWYYPGNTDPQHHEQGIFGWSGFTFAFPETAVNMSVRMFAWGGNDVCRTLRRLQYDNEDDDKKEIFFGGSWIECSHNEHTPGRGVDNHIVANHGDGSVHQKHVFRWATKPNYNFRIRLKGTAWADPEVAAVQCRHQHDTHHFDECAVIKCNEEEMENILDTGTLFDSNYYYGEPGEHDYDPHTFFGENRRFVRCDDPRPDKTDFHKFCGASHKDIAAQQNPLPRVPTANKEDRIAWVEVKPATAAERALQEAIAQQEEETRLAGVALERAQEITALRAAREAAMQDEITALRARLAAAENRG